MRDINLTPISIKRFKQLCPVEHCLDDDLIVTGFDSFPTPKDTRMMECTVVVMCLKGSGSYTIGTVEHRVQASDLLFVPEGQVLGDVHKSADFSASVLIVSKDFLSGILREVSDISNLLVFTREHPVFTLTADEIPLFKDYLSVLLMKMDDKHHAFRRQIVGTILATMVYELCNAAQRVMKGPAQTVRRHQELFELYIALVEKHFREHRQVLWYSRWMGLSPKTLLEITKRVSQRTPNQWIDLNTTQEARLLLRHTTKSVKDIARELGFATQSSFGKFFKEHAGMSPSAYRASK